VYLCTVTVLGPYLVTCPLLVDEAQELELSSAPEGHFPADNGLLTHTARQVMAVIVSAGCTTRHLPGCRRRSWHGSHESLGHCDY
jgi:hypothetical protein